MDKRASPVFGLCPGGRAGPGDYSVPIGRLVVVEDCPRPERGVITLLKRVEAQICRDIFRLRLLIREAESCYVQQEVFQRLVVKREEMLNAVRAELRSECFG